jgi:exosortase N
MVWSGIASIPFILRIDNNSKGSFRFLWLAAIILIFTLITGVATLYFLLTGLAMLFVFESMAGRINWTPLFLLGLICPAFKYFNNIFGFSIRLQLSEIAGKILNAAGYKVTVAGNVMILNNCEFSVDPACVGLKMLAMTLLAGLLMIAFFERKNSRNFSFLAMTLVSISLVALNVISNLFRIVLLVIFRILPENPAHDIVGIVCLIIYVLIPAYFIIKFMAKRPKREAEIEKSTNHKSRLIINIFLLTAVIAAGFKIEVLSPSDSKTISVCNISGYTKSILSNDVVKLEKPGTLIYIKSTRTFYGAEHNPMICWKGSGYEFKHIVCKNICGREVYTGTLQKGKDLIYAAWWFDNGKYQTIDQLDWRWKAFKGENFYLINVNVEKESSLEKEVKELLEFRVNNM